MKKVRLITISLAILALSICACAPLTQNVRTASFDIYGKLEFNADYDSFTRVGQVPNGKTSLPYLRVCAYDRDGGDGYGVDFKYTDYAGNDDLLGCAVADEFGNYTIEADWPGSTVDIYLMTKLCDGDYTGTGTSSTAEVCVRINAAEVSDSSPDNLKVIWSKYYLNTAVATDIQLSWNLSCPNQTGLGVGTVTCTSVEPANWSDPSDEWCACDQSQSWKECVNQVDCSTGTCSDTNSRYGCNKEAVHVYRAIIEPRKTWGGSNRPTASSTFGGADGCPSSSNDDYCDDLECQDEMKAHLAKVENAASDGPCLDPSSTQNGNIDFDDTCIATPTQPFRVLHEQGHGVDQRWKCDTSGHGGVQEKMKTREGFANFYAVAAWFDATATQPKYCGFNNCYDVETGTCDGTERDATRFFWDLRDDVNTGSEGDTEVWATVEVRNVMSAFVSEVASGDDPREERGGSCEIDGSASQNNGVNALDYAYWWDDKRGATSSFCDIITANCMDDQSDTMLSGNLGDVCP